MTKKNYSKIARTVYKPVKTVAKSFMSDGASAKELKAINGVSDILFLIPQSLMMVPGIRMYYFPRIRMYY